jgi:uncharacterized repeat protein (TIGR01451 family)
MNVTCFLRTCAVLALMLLGGGQARAQALILSVTPSASTTLVGGSLTYTISLTNLYADLANVYVTNALSLNVVFANNSNSFLESGFSTNSTAAVFSLADFPINGTAQMTLTVIPLQAGTLINTVTVATDSPEVPLVSTNVVTQVTAPQTDLSVALSSPTNGIFVNDPLNYSITVFNAAASSVSGVQLTNSLQGVKLLSVSPANQTYTQINDLLLFDLGAIAAGGSQTIGLTVQPTNAGTLLLFAAAGAPGVVDVNPADNFATASVVVSDFLSTNLVVSNLTAMVYDPQTGLMNQRVRLWNLDTNPAPSVRVMVAGLTDWLYNAVGTNNGNPYVVYAATLGTNASVDLGLKYFVPTRQPIVVANSSYTAVAIPAFDLSVPAGLGIGGPPFGFTQVVRMPDGGVLIEFESTLGTNYTVVYSSSANFTNAMMALPSVVAPANRVQWIDEGPPETVSAPTNSAARFYRVLRN